MKVVLCWGGISGYMAACWRELSARAGIELLVLNFQKQNNTAFDEQKLMTGINHRVLPEPSSAALREAVQAFGPDVIGVSGWMHKAFFDLAYDRALGAVPMVMSMDTPLLRSWRQHLARLRLRRYLSRMARVVVPGERAWQYARFLGVPESRIRRGVYGIDYAALEPLHEHRLRESDGSWPKKLLFIGRYVPEKGIDVLIAAYRAYRARVEDPWPLTCCGMGPLKPQVAAEHGIEDAGFVQPAQLPQLMARHGALVLPSRYDPWPLAIVEACAAGLPVICTEACGSAVELVRNQYNGLSVATGDPGAMTDALLWAHQKDLATLGRRAQPFAAAYAADVWADRWQRMLGELAK